MKRRAVADRLEKARDRLMEIERFARSRCSGMTALEFLGQLEGYIRCHLWNDINAITDALVMLDEMDELEARLENAEREVVEV
ncbi:MAG: hypothetical protein K6T83_08230 [Alicyclobacillus sp.]|nr:hypothetical protein [Alicyclobacillus sp.]